MIMYEIVNKIAIGLEGRNNSRFVTLRLAIIISLSIQSDKAVYM
jgi:hypothetical protein